MSVIPVGARPPTNDGRRTCAVSVWQCCCAFNYYQYTKDATRLPWVEFYFLHQRQVCWILFLSISFPPNAFASPHNHCPFVCAHQALPHETLKEMPHPHPCSAWGLSVKANAERINSSWYTHYQKHTKEQGHIREQAVGFHMPSHLH